MAKKDKVIKKHPEGKPELKIKNDGLNEGFSKVEKVKDKEISIVEAKGIPPKPKSE